MNRSTIVYRFGCFQLDAADRLLYREGELVPLAPKILDTLLILVEHSGHVVTKEELTRQLWPDTFVGDGTLTQCISLLRKALGDDGKWIETHSRRGYRFNADVEGSTVDRVPAIAADRVGDESPSGHFGSIDDLTAEFDAPSASPLPVSLTPNPANGRLAARTSRVAAAVFILLAGAGWLASRWPPAGTSASVRPITPRLVRLTSTSGLNTDPALSPDGTLLAYASDRGGSSGFDIWGTASRR